MAQKTQDMKLKNVVVDDGSSDERDTASDDELGGLSLEKLNLGAQKKLLVLGLGGVLMDRVHKLKESSVRGRRPDLVCGNFLIFKRRFCAEFLDFCFQRFEVGLWASSMKHNNTDDVFNSIASGISRKFVFLLHQEDCADFCFWCSDKVPKSELWLKELKKIWENNGRHLPFPRGKYSSSNTLLIDDAPCTALLNPPNTAIFPPTYRWDDREDTSLGPNGELRVFLDGLADADDVPSYVKEHAIGQPAITAEHPDWSFYSSVIRHVRKMN